MTSSSTQPPDRLLICTDLDRTLIPNGAQPESSGARERFSALASRPEVTLSYVSGRHSALVRRAIAEYRLPLPDYVIGDVGTTLYKVDSHEDWTAQTKWEDEIATDWRGHTHAELKSELTGVRELRLQEESKQNRFKLSFYFPLDADVEKIKKQVGNRLGKAGVHASLVDSIDEPAGVGLLDVLPKRATKFHAIEFLMQQLGFDFGNTVFCGDSGNDLEVLVSPIAAVLVANGAADVRSTAQQGSEARELADRLYCASGDFIGMNGNYAAGMLEGIAHYHPAIIDWLE